MSQRSCAFLSPIYLYLEYEAYESTIWCTDCTPKLRSWLCSPWYSRMHRVCTGEDGVLRNSFAADATSTVCQRLVVSWFFRFVLWQKWRTSFYYKSQARWQWNSSGLFGAKPSTKLRFSPSCGSHIELLSIHFARRNRPEGTPCSQQVSVYFKHSDTSFRKKLELNTTGRISKHSLNIQLCELNSLVQE